jgi:predicted amidophosphoribosyltransferase
MAIFQSLNELIFPTRCISCGALDQSLCAVCRDSWKLTPHINFLRINEKKNLKTVSALSYSSIVQRVLLASKESGISRADELIVEALRFSILHFIRHCTIDYIVPIPSRKSATRLRGRDFLEELTTEAASPLGITTISPLSISRRVRDQSGLDHNQRWNNLDGAFVTSSTGLCSGRVLLVDDVVTTGATLLEGAKALTYAGFEVVGAATAAVALTSKIT